MCFCSVSGYLLHTCKPPQVNGLLFGLCQSCLSLLCLLCPPIQPTSIETVTTTGKQGQAQNNGQSNHQEHYRACRCQVMLTLNGTCEWWNGRAWDPGLKRLAARYVRGSGRQCGDVGVLPGNNVRGMNLDCSRIRVVSGRRAGCPDFADTCGQRKAGNTDAVRKK